MIMGAAMSNSERARKILEMLIRSWAIQKEISQKVLN